MDGSEVRTRCFESWGDIARKDGYHYSARRKGWGAVISGSDCVRSCSGERSYKSDPPAAVYWHVGRQHCIAYLKTLPYHPVQSQKDRW